MISICAVIAARNEAPYLQVLLPMLANQGIEVAIIDNGSTDESQDLYSFHTDNPVVSVEHIPYRGYFSLAEQLDAKQRVYSRIKHDWVIHHDADEILEHYKTGFTLSNAIQEASYAGYNALNFDEFVFLPEPDADLYGRNYYEEIVRYYFFEPYKNRLNRAWKRNTDINNTLAGGHILSGSGISFSPYNHILRHYIVLGYEHAKRKYINRVFGEQDLNRGWHGNRLNFNEKNLALPHSSKFLFQLPVYFSKKFRRDLPSSKHYWEWEEYK